MNESPPPSEFALRQDLAWSAGVWFAERTDSTNAEALRHPAQELQPGTVFWGLHQSAGRGRLGRRWEDVPGKALTFSLVFPQVADVERLHWLHLAAGCAVAEVAESLRAAAGGGDAATRLGLKWPNDVVEVDEAAPAGYRKFAGILTEVQSEPGGGAEGQRAAVGIGINVNQREADFPAELRGNATSLASLTGREFELRDILEEVLAGIGRRQRMIEAGDVDEVRAELARRDVLRGATVEVQLPTGAKLTGRAAGLDARARLQVHTATKEHYHLESGEVVHLRPHRD